jgi:hypothetical protein
MRDAILSHFDMVVCWNIDGLGRPLQKLVEILK